MKIGSWFLLGALFVAAACKTPPEEEPVILAHDYAVLTPALTNLSVQEHSYGNKLPTSWQPGDKLLICDDALSSVRQFTAGDQDIDNEKLILSYEASDADASKVYVARFGKNVSLDGWSAVVRPALDGSLSEANLLRGEADINARQIDLSPIAGIIEFTLLREDVAKIVITEDGDVFPKTLRCNLQSGELDLQDYAHTLELDVSRSGNYYLPVAPGTDLHNLVSDLYDRAGTLLLHSEIQNDLAFAAGRLYTFGDIGKEDGNTEPQPRETTVPVPFVFNAATGTGTVAQWPFREKKGDSSALSTEQVLHASNNGYAVYFSGLKQYLHSKNGWVLCMGKKNDFLEFPTFTRGRIKSVSIAFGASPCNPSFADSRGQILAGGEMRDETDSGVLYTYEFENALVGEPCRMMFNTKENVSILQVTPVYVFDSEDVPPINTIHGVYLNDDSNEVFCSGNVRVSGALKMTDGSTTGVTCGIEYEDYYAETRSENVGCSPESFRYSLARPSAAKYSFRAWAASEKGWREYTNSIQVCPYSILLDFWKEGELNTALGDEPLDSSEEQPRTVKGADHTIKTFGSFSYDASSGLTVSSSGSAYIKFPAIPGKALSEVYVQSSLTSEDGAVLVCLDPADRFSAVSKTYTLSPGKTNSVVIVCKSVLSDTAYSLLFSSSGKYGIKRIVAVYNNSDVPSNPDSEEPDDTATDPTGIFDYSILSQKSHPRLLIDADGFADLRRKVYEERSSNRLLAELNDLIIGIADTYTSSKLRDIRYKLDDSGKRLLEECRWALLQMSSMSYAYQMTGNPKYLSRARTLLSQVCAFQDWHPSHFLDPSEMTLAVALAYDWLYNALTLEERTLIHSRIVNYGLRPGLTDDYVTTVGNQNQVSSACMIAGALAVYEKDKAISAQTIERSVPANIAMASQIYAPDGNYAEGYSYWRYGTGFQVIMMKMLDTIFGHNGGMDGISGMDKTAEYMLFMDGITASFSYADGGNPGGFASKTAMWYFASKTGDRSLVSNELKLFKDGLYESGSENRVMFIMPAILKDFHVDYDVPAHHSRRVWSGTGRAPVVMVHTGWNLDDSDHYLGIKAGAANAGHGHMDAGSFVYDALGKRWSADPGKKDYVEMELAFRTVGGAGSGQTSYYWDFLKLNNYGHSTISVNAHDGSFQKRYPSDHKYDGAAVVSEVIETASELGAVLDMSAPLQGSVQSATRTIKLVNEQDLVIVDVITAKPEFDAPVIWHMITPADIKLETGYEILSQDDKTMYLKATAQPAVGIAYVSREYVRPPYWISRTWDNPETVHISGFEATVPAGTTVTFTTTLSPQL